MIPNGTRVLNGKGFLHEIDHRTPTYNVNLDEFVTIQWMVPWKDQAETSAGLKREFSLATINNASLWCFDMWGGVFKTPETMKIVAQGKEIWDQYASGEYKSLAEVALVVDPQSARLLNDQNPDVRNIYTGVRNKLNRMGAPFEVFSFNDLSRADLSSIKLIIFPGLFEVTPEKEDILKKFVFNNNRTVLFAYAAGISNGKNLNTERVKKLTGTPFKTAGVNTVKYKNWNSVYVPDYETITPKVLKQLAVKAKVNVYCQDEVPVYANERLMAIHMAEGGEKVINLPVAAEKIKELFSEEVIKVKNKKFHYKFSTPDTALFEIIS